MPNFQSNNMIPGVQAYQETFENQVYFGEEHHQVWGQAPLSGAARDAGNTGQTETLRAGLLLGKVTSTSLWKEWDPTSILGDQVIRGILTQTTNTQRLGANANRLMGRILISGNVKPERLIVPGTSALTIVGNASEFDIRSQMAENFLFADDVKIGQPTYAKIQAHVVDYTILDSDSGTLFTTRGAAAAVNFTLPATAKKGLSYKFFNIADFEMMVTSGTADTLIVFNDATADTVAYTTAAEHIGGSFEVIGDGTGWMVIASAHSQGAASQTITVAT